MSDSLWPHELWPTRLFCPWDFLGKNTGVGSPSLLQGIFSLPRDWTWVSCTAGRFFTAWTTREALNLIYTWPRTAATATAKSLQSCLTLCDPIDASPPGSAVPGILQARTLEWVAVSFSNAWKWKVKGKLLSCVQLSATPWTAAHQAPPSMGFSRQEYWSGVPLPNGILSSHKKEWNLAFVTIWINLESTMSSEISQIEKDKYCMI